MCNKITNTYSTNWDNNTDVSYFIDKRASLWKSVHSTQKMNVFTVDHRGRHIGLECVHLECASFFSIQLRKKLKYSMASAVVILVSVNRCLGRAEIRMDMRWWLRCESLPSKAKYRNLARYSEAFRGVTYPLHWTAEAGAVHCWRKVSISLS